MCCEYQSQYRWPDSDKDTRYFFVYDDDSPGGFALYYHSDIRWCPRHYWHKVEGSQFGPEAVPLPLNVITVLVREHSGVV